MTAREKSTRLTARDTRRPRSPAGGAFWVTVDALLARTTEP
jgi:hypothetical protein